MNLPAKRCFCARRSEFDAIRKFIEAECACLPHSDRQRLVLIVEELFCNSIDHGYGGDCEQPVWLTLAPTTEDCRVTYEDTAPAHDPFAGAKAPALEAAAERRPIGGLGVFLIGRYCASTHYERSGGRNVIKLCVLRASSGGPTDTHEG